MTGRPAVLDRVAAAVGRDVIGWERPECGLSAAERWVTRLAGGSSVFVKAATDPDTASWLATERRALEVAGTELGPAVIDWLDDGEFPILITEDLSGSYWPAGTGSVSWRDGDMAAVFDGLARLRDRPGDDLARLPEPPSRWEDLLAGGSLVRAGWCSRNWTDRNGPAVITADRRALSGDGLVLVHGDVRSDNLCIGIDGRARFVDWSQAGAGDRFRDLALLLPTLRLEGGPPPSDVLTEPAGLITRLAGATIARAFGDRRGPDWLQEVLRQLALINLVWVCDVLDLARPDGPRLPVS
ncbi:MAG: phosphotransferase [Microlunatus sp.]|nr:phosphotransferase [Microlunatus sp.]